MAPVLCAEGFRIAERQFLPSLNRVIDQDGASHNLEPKVFGVLLSLARRPGEVVTREELFEEVWPGTAVEEGVLFRAISELRRLFHDQARDSRVIETIRSRGYRLIAPVIAGQGGQRPQDTPAASPSPVRAERSHLVPLARSDDPARASAHGPTSSHSGVSRQAPGTDSAPAKTSNSWPVGASAGRQQLQNRLLLVLLSSALVAAGVLLAMQNRQVAVSAPTPPAEPRPRTAMPGAEILPSLSPDGQGMVFAWFRIERAKSNILLQLAGDSEPRPLIDGFSESSFPAWSPDGRSIAVWSLGDGGMDLVLLPALGGPERVLLRDRSGVDQIAWAPDSTALYTSFAGDDKAIEVHRVAIADGSFQSITSAAAGHFTDRTAAIGPRGERIAFVRRESRTYGDIWIQDIDDVGSAERVLEGAAITGLTWSPTMPYLVFSAYYRQRRGLWALDLDDGTIAWLELESAQGPTFSADGSTLAFSRGGYRSDLWQIELDRGGELTMLVESSRSARSPATSVTGKLAFASNRDGDYAIWLADSDGSNPRRIAGGDSFASRPAWSRDGRRLAYEADLDQQLDVFVLDSLHQPRPRRLTRSPRNDRDPVWSPDGRFIYFSSNRRGPWQIWRIAAGGGTATPVEGAEGRSAKLTPDGTWLLFYDFTSLSVRRVPAAGGHSESVLQHPRLTSWDVFDGSRVIYTLAGDSTLRLRHLHTGADEDLIELDSLDFSTMDLDAKGDRLVFCRLTSMESDIQSLTAAQLAIRLGLPGYPG